VAIQIAIALLVLLALLAEDSHCLHQIEASWDCRGEDEDHAIEPMAPCEVADEA